MLGSYDLEPFGFGTARALGKSDQLKRSKTDAEEHAMTIQKKSLISTLNTTNKAIVASTPAETASVTPATKNTASRVAPSRVAASRVAGSRVAASRVAASRVAAS